MTIVIAGGSGFLGQNLASASRERRPSRPDADAPDAASPTRLPGIPTDRQAQLAPTSRRLDAVVNLAGEDIAGRTLDRQAERGAAVQPRAVDANAGASDRRVRAAAARVHQRIGGRLLRPPRRRASHRSHPGRHRTFWRGFASNGSRRRARSIDRRPAWRSCARQSRSTKTAARCRRCCCRSSSGSAPRLDRAMQFMPWIHVDDWAVAGVVVG